MMWKYLIAGLAMPALLLAPAPANAATVTPHYSPDGMLSFALLTATNEERAEAGCPPLRVETELIIASVEQSGYMATTRQFGHLGADGSTFVDRAQEAGYTKPAGENIAWGYRDTDQVMAAWMASPPHRANILNCEARSVGIGTRRAADGTPYFTQVFGWE
ncbi:CAP domain-containing protein [Actinoplanes sp. NPDC049265]|uniref:CAP domain-containing protein n=1 Tax=Actinoplanes sp. NPDC049265 TaxID=3363902 RepID=UPI00371AD5AC